MLLDDIDEKQSVNKAKELLKRYGKLQYLSAGSIEVARYYEHNQQTLNEDVNNLIKDAEMNDYSILDIKKLSIKQSYLIMEIINRCIRSIDNDDYEFILNHKFINNRHKIMPDQAIAMDLHYSNTVLNEKKRQALVCFAYAFPLRELIVYKSEVA